jgi:hypothetical protein
MRCKKMISFLFYSSIKMNKRDPQKFAIYDKIRNNNNIKKNTGIRWNKQELLQLKKEIDNKLSYEEIALIHNRTEEAIRIQVIKKIIKPIITKENKHEIAEKYNIVLSGIEYYINYHKKII